MIPPGLISLPKLVRYGVTLYIILSLNFFIPFAMPGDPLVNLLGEDARFFSAEEEARLREAHNLDRPLGERYLVYLQKTARFDLGRSIQYGRPVYPLVLDKLKWTLILLLPSLSVGFLLALLLGSHCGWRVGSRLERVSTFFFIFIYSLPQFLLAMMSVYLFSFRLGLFPLGGFWSGQATGLWSQAGQVLHHLFLPWLILALSSASALYLVVRNSIIQVISENFVFYGRARGLGEKRILFVHALRNALPPVINFAALNIGFLVSGALLIEIVFSLNGMGELIYESAIRRDYPVLRGCLLVLTWSVLCANFLADLLCRLIDPRMGGDRQETAKRRGHHGEELSRH